MPAEGPQDEGLPAGAAAIDRALSAWRQGDCVVEPQWFSFRVSQSGGLTTAGNVAIAAGVDLAEEEAAGLVVVTQTCDIIRSCSERPFIELAPLVEVSADVSDDIKKGRRPGFAFIPGLADRRLVADLDRIMTAEKSVVATWNRVAGCSTDDEVRALSAALARKRVRFAFPDDFVALVRPLQERLTSKHGKNSAEGRALRALREIRVAATPSWDAPRVEVMFYFIPTGEQEEFETEQWFVFLEQWLDLVKATGRFVTVEGLVATLEGLTAADYVTSDPLDLDHLSG